MAIGCETVIAEDVPVVQLPSWPWCMPHPPGRERQSIDAPLHHTAGEHGIADARRRIFSR
jgi:hypothetical protein